MKPIISQKRGCRYWLNLALVGLAGLFLGALFIFYVAYPILFTRGAAHPRRAPVCCYTPSDLGTAYENVSFITRDGVTLRGWYIPSQNGAAVLIAHPIAGNRMGHVYQAIALAKRGYGVLLFDLRAHGESDGDTISFGGEDAIAAAAYLKSRSDVTGRIGAMGFSYGGLVVLQAAAVGPDIQAVVADSATPARFIDAPPPENLEDWLILPYERMFFIGFERERVVAPMSLTEAFIKISPRPILFVCGAQSRTDCLLVRHYYSVAQEPKALWEIPNAGHVGGWNVRPEEYEARIVAFFEEALLEKR